ncbi:hypothetical protein EWM64_g2229 [Hericium alpestre]|uniref:NAD-dependent epimerase/dehydratase domain-containing protein n=1 Tax=Hericium alpestre TaxID=135208 RepID=A0A4Z0A5Y4_9AGAM|nr:hypothetical protein EWM64_g2229 [Hericium alpestre]
MSFVLDVLILLSRTARSLKADRVRADYASYGEKFEVAVVDDVAISDLTPALRDVNALVHVASPMPFRASPEDTLRSAVDGSRRILETALSHNVKKFVITASTATLYTPELAFKDIACDENSWNEATREEALSPDASSPFVYATSKALAEKEIWKFAKEHPDVDITTILPPLLYGPYSPHAVLDAASLQQGSNALLYSLIAGPEGRPFAGHGWAFPLYIHVADAAKAHVLALKAPPSPKPKRIIVGGGEFFFSDAIRHIAAVRPELKARLPDLSAAPEDPKEYVKLDLSNAERILGLKEYKDWKETVEGTIDDLVFKEKIPLGQ